MGKKVTGQHAGTITLSEGTLTSNGKKINGGSFAMDMTSLKDEGANTRLEDHLKSDDFFFNRKNIRRQRLSSLLLNQKVAINMP